MKTLPILLAALSFAVPARAADVSGEWAIDISWRRLGGTHTTVCMLQQEDRQLTGNCWWGGGRYSVTGNRDTSGVSWSLDLDEDGFVIFEGTFDEDDLSIQGEVSADRGGGPFTATRR